MKKLMLSVSLLSLAVAEVHAADSLTDALKEGKASLQVRPRYEWVSDDNAPKADTAKAMTVRTVVGYKTGAISGVSGYLELEDIRALDTAYNVPVVQPNAKYPTVLDAEYTGVNQAYLAGYGAKVGKQKLIFNNARFIGDSGWRQNDQTFVAASYDQARLLPWLDVQMAYATKVALVNSQMADLRLPVVNLKAHAPLGATVTAFWAGLDGRESKKNMTTTADGLIANEGVDKSRQYRVLRVDGKQGKFLYDFSYGQQRAYADGTAANTPDASYRDMQLGYDLGFMTVKLQQEILGGKFQTPLATLHAFNGWADRFLATPDKGLVDRNVKLSGKAMGGLMLAAAYHRFSAESGSVDFGEEIDASVSKAITPNLTAMVKVAHFDGTGEITKGTQAQYTKDLTKGWVQLDYKF